MTTVDRADRAAVGQVRKQASERGPRAEPNRQKAGRLR